MSTDPDTAPSQCHLPGVPRTCDTCGAPMPVTARVDAVTCSARCRQARARRQRAATEAAYVVTEEDRAAMRRAAELVPIPWGKVPPPSVVRT